MIKSRERNKQLFSAAEADFWDSFVQQSDLPPFFSHRKANLKIPINSDSWQARIARPWKMALGCFLSRFRIVVSWDLTNLYKSSSGIWPFSVSHCPGLTILSKSSSGIRPTFKFNFWGLKNVVSHFNWTRPSKKSWSRCKWFYALLEKFYKKTSRNSSLLCRIECLVTRMPPNSNSRTIPER